MKPPNHSPLTAAAIVSALVSLSHLTPDQLLLGTVCFIAIYSTIGLEWRR